MVALSPTDDRRSDPLFAGLAAEVLATVRDRRGAREKTCCWNAQS
jgi:hypothetical protein